MKIRLLSLGVLGALISAGCAKHETTTPTAAATPPSAATSGTPTATATPAKPTSTPAASTAAATSNPAASASASAKSGSARVIEITANDQMKFSLATMEAKAGEELKVVLTNAGTLPKEAMGHNWVLLKKGVDVTAFATAAMTAKDTDYVPAGMKDQVVAAIPVLGPKKTGEVTFKAPEPGEYTFICSFPGHYMIMKGTLTVK
jgi:azurin